MSTAAPKKTGTIGSRLRAEREKLGLSQAGLAEKVGITARSQRNYESGTRVPDAEYLMAVSKIGVDLVIVLHGGYGDHDDNDLASMMAIEQAFGIKHEDLERAIDLALVDDTVNAFDPDVLFREIRRYSPIVQAIVERESGLDTSLLADILARVDAAIRPRGLEVAGAKKAQAIAMLYRAFKASGTVDQKMIDETITLAAS